MNDFLHNLTAKSLASVERVQPRLQLPFEPLPAMSLAAAESPPSESPLMPDMLPGIAMDDAPLAAPVPRRSHHQEPQSEGAEPAFIPQRREAPADRSRHLIARMQRSTEALPQSKVAAVQSLSLKTSSKTTGATIDEPGTPAAQLSTPIGVSAEPVRPGGKAPSPGVLPLKITPSHENEPQQPEAETFVTTSGLPEPLFPESRRSSTAYRQPGDVPLSPIELLLPKLVSGPNSLPEAHAAGPDRGSMGVMAPQPLPAPVFNAPPAAPTIRVTIGRIEVRAAEKPAPARPRKTSGNAKVMSLGDYLRSRATGGKS